jgi:hypothetical protein
MLAVLFIAASLAAQAWIFRDSPGRPADPCARSAEHCPEADLDSLYVRQAEALARQRALARGEPFSVRTPEANASLTAPRVSADSLQAEACRLLPSGE